MSYIEKAEQNKANAEKAKAFDKREQEEMMQRTIDAHVRLEQEKAARLQAQKEEEEYQFELRHMDAQRQRHQALADEQAIANGFEPSNSPYARAARDWVQPPPGPSIMDELTSYLDKVSEKASSAWGQVQDRWDKYQPVDTYRGEPKDPHADLKRRVREEQEAYEASKRADAYIRQMQREQNKVQPTKVKHI